MVAVYGSPQHTQSIINIHLLENLIYVYVLKILLQYSWNESHYKNLNRMSYFLCNAGSVGELHFLLLRACSHIRKKMVKNVYHSRKVIILSISF